MADLVVHRPEGIWRTFPIRVRVRVMARPEGIWRAFPSVTTISTHGRRDILLRCVIWAGCAGAEMVW